MSGLQWIGVSPFGTHYGPLVAPDAEAARAAVRAMMRAEYPANIPATQADRATDARMSGTRVLRYAPRIGG